MASSNSQRGNVPILEILILVGIIAIGGAIWYNQHQAKITNPPKQAVPRKAQQIVNDQTLNWVAFSSKTGQFSLRYKPDWKILVGTAPNCIGNDSIIYLAPTDGALAKCGSDFTGQMNVTSIAGQSPGSYILGSEYSGTQNVAVTINGVKGQRQSGTVSNPDGQLSQPKGTKLIRYVFDTNGRLYVATYIQTPSGALSQDVSADFDTMIKSTMKFTP